MKKEEKRVKRRNRERILSAVLSVMMLSGLSWNQPVSAAGMHDLEVDSYVEQVNTDLPQTAWVGPYISPDLNVNSSKKVQVIIQLSQEPALEQNEADLEAVREQQSAFIEAARDLGIKITVENQLEVVQNAVVVTLAANEIPKVAKIPGVVAVFANHNVVFADEIPQNPDDDGVSDTYQSESDHNWNTIAREQEATQSSQAAMRKIRSQNLDTSLEEINNTMPLYQMGVQAAWDMGFNGKGLKVGVVSTGIDPNHPDLINAYKGGYNAIDPGADPLDDRDPNTHPVGTYNAGVIVGRAANPNSVLPKKGIAYEADLYAYKVMKYIPERGYTFGTTANIIAGIEQAVRDEMDVLVVGVQDSTVRDPNSPTSIAVNNAVLAGTVVVSMGGNSGSSKYSINSPGSAMLGLTVGAVDSERNTYAAKFTSSFDSDKTYTVNLMSTSPGQWNFKDTIDTTPVDAVYVGIGDVKNYAGKDVVGKIVLISRGVLPFVDKIKLAAEHGAKAAIIFNGKADGNDPILDDTIAGLDGYINSVVASSPTTIPTFDMKGTEGRALAKQVLDNPDVPLTFTFDAEYSSTRVQPGDYLASWSSRGPLQDERYSIKPDLTAPGVDVYTTSTPSGNENYDKAYSNISGASLHACHVAGLALLLKQQHPDWTPFDIRAALANTASRTFDGNGKAYGVYEQGAGRVNMENAVATPAILQTVEPLTILNSRLLPQDVINYGANASFGAMQPGSEAKAIQLQLKNSSVAPITYNARIVMHDELNPEQGAIQAVLDGLDNGSLTVDGKSVAPFALKVNPQPGATEGFYEGEVVLDRSGVPSLHLPFVVRVASNVPDNGTGIQDMQLSKAYLVLDDNGASDSIDVSVRLTATNVSELKLQVWGMDDSWIGTLGTVDNNDQVLHPGLIQFRAISNTYQDGNGATRQLPEGGYYLTIESDVGISVRSKYFAIIKKSILQQIINQERDQFQANITNTTEIGKHVLTFPTKTDIITYKVTGSNNTVYIDNTGVLQKVIDPNTTVELTVEIASKHDPLLKVEKSVTVQVGSPPVANPAGSAVLKGTKVALSTSPGATIYYTTNGSKPTAASTKYNSPIVVTNPMTIRAISVKEGYGNSAEMSESYTIKPAPPAFYPVQDVKLDQTKVTLEVEGESVTLKPTIMPTYATIQEVTWSSSNPKVATVDKNGVVTPRAEGEATIVVTTLDGGKTAICEVTVNSKAQAVELIGLRATERNVLLRPGKSVKFDVFAVYSDGREEKITADEKVTYRSSSSRKASVVPGMITAGSDVGAATIRISYGKKRVTLPVTISKIYVKKLVVSEKSVKLELGQDHQLSLSALLSDKSEKDASKLAMWTSANPKIVSVENGKIVATGLGRTVITASYGGKKVTIRVYVTKPTKSEE